MLITTLLFIPLLGILAIITNPFNHDNNSHDSKIIALAASILNMIISLFIFIVFDFSNINYQFVQEVHEFNGINIYLGIDGLSIYFVLLTTILIPIVLLSS
jgi:NADH:ubiquinone oxidoreductase subunit 4 (subunit M)